MECSSELFLRHVLDFYYDFINLKFAEIKRNNGKIDLLEICNYLIKTDMFHFLPEYCSP